MAFKSKLCVAMCKNMFEMSLGKDLLTNATAIFVLFLLLLHQSLFLVHLIKCGMRITEVFKINLNKTG